MQQRIAKNATHLLQFAFRPQSRQKRKTLMKMSLYQKITIVCIFAAAIVVAPLQVVQADDYVHHIDVYIDRTTHYNGMVTHTTTAVDIFKTIDVRPGKHDHPDPTCTPHFNDIDCGSSQCYYCNR